MKSLLKGLFSALLILGIIACKKNKEGDNSTPPGITFGDATGMIVQRYDSILTPNHSCNVVFENHAAGIDFKESFLGDAKYNLLEIGAYFDLTFMADPKPKLYYYTHHIDDTVYVENDSVYNTSAIRERWDTTYCFPPTGRYSWTNFSGPYIKVNNNYERFSFEDEVTFSDDPRNDLWKQSFFTTSKVAIGDTLIVDHRMVYNDCNNQLHLGEERYIGVKFKVGNKEKLGWIKLKVIDEDHVLLIESAVQQ